MRPTAWAIVLVALGMAGAVSVQAHHPIRGKFDPDQSLTLEGIVTLVDWRNPHAHIFINVAGDDDLVNWAIELESPRDLQRNGWSRETVVPGDALVVSGIRARNGSNQIWGRDVRVAGTGKTVFAVEPATPPVPLASRPTPRWPDGQPRLGPVPGGTGGYWAFPSKTALVEDGVDVVVDGYGQLRNLTDAGRVAPMQAWAETLYRYRQSRFLRDDPIYLNCKPPGGPRQFQRPQGVAFIEDRNRRRIFVLLGSGNSNYRILYLDGREHVGQVRGDDDNPLYYGRSVGQWEGDALVLDTRGFNEDFWFTNGGLPHTNLLQMIERISRPDFDTLTYEVTIDDPGAYTRPWTSRWSLRWVGGEDLPQYICQENRP